MRLTGDMLSRRPGRLLVPAVVVASLVVPAPVGAGAPGGTEERTPTTVSDFYPEESNLSDCVGLVERPGCGSDARGGWRQTAIFGMLAAGLAVIVGRVIVGVRRNRRSDDPGR